MSQAAGPEHRDSIPGSDDWFRRLGSDDWFRRPVTRRAYIGLVKLFITASLASGFILVSSTCPAQGVAVSAGTGIPLYQPELAPYGTSFVPPFLFGMTATGRGTQTMTLDRSARPSFWGALEWFPARHAGLLARGSFLRAPLSGSNAPYLVIVDYVARQPPDFVERQYHYERSTPWPETTGHLDTWSFDITASVAARSGSGVRAHADGGIALVGISGTFGPVPLTTFQLGGHSVLFTNEYRLMMGLARTWAAAGVVSGGISVPLGGRVGLDVSGRAVLPRTVTAEALVRSVGSDIAISELDPADAQRMLAPAPVPVKLGRVELLVGIRVAL